MTKAIWLPGVSYSFDADGALKEKETNPWSNAEVGDTITFGTYEQDNDVSNGPEAIEWRVLAKEDGKLLLISVYGLDEMDYNNGTVAVTWETCSVREWLNNKFYNTAFNSNEQSKIYATTLVNPDNPVYSADGGNDTIDKVFLLSSDEVLKYFDLTININSDKKDVYAIGDDCCCMPTAYAIARGAAVFGWVEEFPMDEQVYEGNSWWLLRSPGYDQEWVSICTATGRVNVGGYPSGSSSMVRPAIWITQ